VKLIVARIAAFLGAFFAPVGLAVAAHADVADPTGGAGATFISDLTAWVTTYGVPIAFGLLLLGIVIRVAIKYAKRGAASL
jgi:hypothetical protein